MGASSGTLDRPMAADAAAPEIATTVARSTRGSTFSKEIMYFANRVRLP